MTESSSNADSPRDPQKVEALGQAISTEYYEILKVVDAYDGRILIIKGWSVTLSLAALGLGFQQQHFALFALAAVSGAGFWSLDALMKGYQYRYYVRMREIEYTAYLINAVPLAGRFKDAAISAPRIDMMWGFRGYREDDEGNPLPPRQYWWRHLFGQRPEPPHPYDWRAEEPWRRTPQEIYDDLRGRWRWPNVALPHVVAVILGFALFVAAAVNTAGLAQLSV